MKRSWSKQKQKQPLPKTKQKQQKTLNIEMAKTTSIKINYIYRNSSKEPLKFIRVILKEKKLG